VQGRGRPESGVIMGAVLACSKIGRICTAGRVIETCAVGVGVRHHHAVLINKQRVLMRLRKAWQPTAIGGFRAHWRQSTVLKACIGHRHPHGQRRA